MGCIRVFIFWPQYHSWLRWLRLQMPSAPVQGRGQRRWVHREGRLALVDVALEQGYLGWCRYHLLCAPAWPLETGVHPTVSPGPASINTLAPALLKKDHLAQAARIGPHG